MFMGKTLVKKVQENLGIIAGGAVFLAVVVIGTLWAVNPQLVQSKFEQMNDPQNIAGAKRGSVILQARQAFSGQAFDSNVVTIPSGSQVELRWISQNATSCSA